MDIYMGFSESEGEQDGAVLIFAENFAQAEKLADPFLHSWGIDPCDQKVSRIKDNNYLYRQKCRNKPHVIESPITCESCELWGTGELNEDGICEDCEELEENGYDKN